MKTWRAFIITATISLSSTHLFGQQLASGFFTDGFLYRHEMNPAIANSQGYISFPALGNVNVGLRGNVALSDFVYVRDGKTVLFMNPMVSTDDFLSEIKDKNRMNTEAKIGIMSVGFKALNGYNTVAINLRSNVNGILPGELFRMAKEGLKNQTYDLSSTSFHADAFLELALGHSHQIDKHWQVGGKVKFLVGGANIDAKFNHAKFELSDNYWTAVTDAEVQASIKNMTYKKEEKLRGPEGNQTRHEYVSGIDTDGFGLNGFGIAFDFGACYRLNDDWNFGLSVLDLGFINWKNNMLATTGGKKTVTTDDYVFSADDDASNSFSNEWDRFTEGMSSLYELEDKGNQGSRTRALGATVNVSAEYSCPFYRPLTFGLLNTTKIQGDFSWTEFRLSANVAPVKFFSATVDVAEGTFGPAVGMLLNLHPKHFNFFVGMDYTFWTMTKQGAPTGSKCNASMGINFPI